MDGLDIADCSFTIKYNTRQFILHKGKTFKYSNELRKNLSHAHLLSPTDLEKLDIDFGVYIANQIESEYNLDDYDLIACHGHTVFHKPEEGFSLQLGNGKSIFEGTGIPTVVDFRNADISKGGQGAPLVPKGELDLFSNYQGFVNLGGISNMSIRLSGNSMIGFDISFFNIALNEISRLRGKQYDDKGEMASSGNCISELEKLLNDFEFYSKSGAKSLDRLIYEKKFKPIIEKFINTNSPEDILNTLVTHFSNVISENLNRFLDKNQNVLVTGGGGYNDFFMSELGRKTFPKLVKPENGLIEFKEAIIFAYLGILRVLEEKNCIASVTGASEDTVGGVLYGDFKIKQI